MLAHEDNPAALAAVLQTNKHLATITLPYLYGDPFRFSTLGNSIKSGWSNSLNPIKNEQDFILRRNPTHTLLRSLPSSTMVPKVLSLALEPFDLTCSVSNSDDEEILPDTLTATFTNKLYQSSFNYLAYVRHLHLQPWSPGIDHLWRWSAAPPSINKFILSPEFKSVCQSMFGPAPNPHIPRRWGNGWEKPYFQGCFQMMYFRAASWALANPILHQLKSLTIPLSILSLYIEKSTMKQLGNLEHVHFILDNVVNLDATQNIGESYDGTAEYAPLIDFVELHTHFFPGVLKSVSALSNVNNTQWKHRPRGTTRDTFRCRMPESTQMTINHMLPPLAKPTSITKYSEMLHLLAHIPRIEGGEIIGTYLDKVTDLNSLVLDNQTSEDLFIKNGQYILQHCRSLKNLKVQSLGNGGFRWAVDEKDKFAEFCANGFLSNVRKVDEQDSSPLHSIKSANNDTQSSIQLEQWRRGLIPLKHIELNGRAQILTDEIDDILFAFNQTLQDLSVESYVYSNGPQYFTIRKFGWINLPALTQLSLNIYSVRLCIEYSEFFLNCPNIETLSLVDGTLDYQHVEILDYLRSLPSSPASISITRLESLFLKGWSALTFDPAIFFASTPPSQLKALSITHQTSYVANDDAYSHYITDDYEDEHDEDLFDRRYGYAKGIWSPEEDDSLSDNNCFIPPMEDILRNNVITKSNDIGFSEIQLPLPSWNWDLPALTTLTLTAVHALHFKFSFLRYCPLLETLELGIRSLSRQHSRIISLSELSSSPNSPIVGHSLKNLRLQGRWGFKDPDARNQFLNAMFPKLEYLCSVEWIDISVDDILNWIRESYEKGTRQPIKKLYMRMARPWLEQQHCINRLASSDKYGKDDEAVLTRVKLNHKLYVLLK
ncbi:hypothetical protein FBU30_007446 [Linnemannia zychae]|nr:hypothetical protein FBU30_007446 [Linnemannia zychae]